MTHFKQQTASFTSYTYAPSQVMSDEACLASLRLSQLGRFVTNGRFNFEQVAAATVLHVVRSGQGVIRAEGKAYDVGPGDIFTFFRGNHYHYFDRPQTPWHYTWITLQGEFMESAPATLGLTREQPHWQGDYASLLEPLFQEIIAAYQLTETPAIFPTTIAWRVLDLLARHSVQQDRSEKQDVAEIARSLIDNDFMMIFTVEELAERLGVSRSTLFRKFRERYLISPKEYLDVVRMERAKHLLRQSRSSIKEIAAACGFHDSHYFSRAYKKACGFPPSEGR